MGTITDIKNEPCLHIAGVNYDSFVDGPGVRAAIYLSGCRHHCPGCHNADTHNPEYGQALHSRLLEDIGYAIMERPYLSGITLTGGDPLYDPEQTHWMLEDLLAQIGRDTNVWMYTGALWEDVCDLPIMNSIDVLVDGPFIKEQADKRLQFKGSANQRIIDVKKSLAAGEVILWQAEERHT